MSNISKFWLTPNTGDPGGGTAPTAYLGTWGDQPTGTGAGTDMAMTGTSRAGFQTSTGPTLASQGKNSTVTHALAQWISRPLSGSGTLPTGSYRVAFAAQMTNAGTSFTWTGQATLLLLSSAGTVKSTVFATGLIGSSTGRSSTSELVVNGTVSVASGVAYAAGDMLCLEVGISVNRTASGNAAPNASAWFGGNTDMAAATDNTTTTDAGSSLVLPSTVPILDATGYKDTVARFLLRAQAIRDTVARLRLQATATRDTGARFALLAPVPNAPTGLTLSNTGKYTWLTASWTAPTVDATHQAATGYYLDVSSTSGFTGFVPGYNGLDVGNVTTFDAVGLDTGTTYYVRVRAYNANGAGANSGVQSGATAAAPDAQAIINRLVSHWRLDESSGNRVDANYTNDLTPNNAPGSTPGVIGNAATFHAASSQWLSHATNPSLDIFSNASSVVRALSIVVWFKLDSLPSSGNWYNLVAKQGPSDQGDYWLAVDSGGHIRWTISNQRNGAVVLSTATVGTGGWHMAAATLDPTFGGTLYVSVDGGAQDSAAVSSMTLNGDAHDFTIGAYDPTATNTQFFDGAIDSVSYWWRTISTGDITSLYNTGAGLDYPFLVPFERDTASRFALVGTGARDTRARLRLASPASWRDTAARLRLAGIALRDQVARYRLSGQQYRDTGARFGLSSMTPLRFRVAWFVLDVPAAAFTQAWRFTTARFALLAARVRDTGARFRLRSATVYRDLAVRFRSQGAAGRDTGSRYRVQAPGAKDTAWRLRLLAAGGRDTAARLLLRSVLTLRDTSARHRLRATAHRDTASRLNVGAASIYRDTAARQRLVSPATWRDLPGRFRLAMPAVVRDTATRLRLRATAYRDTASRFNVGTAPSYRFTVARLRMLATGYRLTATRFVLGVTRWRDTASRLRLLATAARDTGVRYRLAGLVLRDTAARQRLASAPLERDTRSRALLRALTLRDTLSRIRIASGSTLRDTASRARLAGSRTRDTAARLALRSATADRDTGLRHRLGAGPLWRATAARYRLAVLVVRDTEARFLLRVPGVNRDTAARYRLGRAAGRDTGKRFALAATVRLDTAARLGLLAAGGRDTGARLALALLLHRDTLARLGVESPPVARDTGARFVILFGGQGLWTPPLHAPGAAEARDTTVADGAHGTAIADDSHTVGVSDGYHHTTTPGDKRGVLL